MIFILVITVKARQSRCMKASDYSLVILIKRYAVVMVLVHPSIILCKLGSPNRYICLCYSYRLHRSRTNKATNKKKTVAIINIYIHVFIRLSTFFIKFSFIYSIAVLIKFRTLQQRGILVVSMKG